MDTIAVVGGRWRKRRVKTEEAQADAGIMLKWLHSAISDHACHVELETGSVRGTVSSVTDAAV